jgi:hypothetical protein
MAPSSFPTRRYSQAAVQAILSQALQSRTTEDFSRAQLEEMAADLSIDLPLLEQAEQQWQQAEAATQQRQRRRAARRRAWVTYGLGSVGMLALDIATAGTITWAIYPILGWGLGLAVDGYGCQQKRQGKGKAPQLNAS